MFLIRNKYVSLPCADPTEDGAVAEQTDIHITVN